ncbi:MAG: hypothetical protein K9K79_02905, partial [Desulfohalobiaceae bacterium]|nr:hypothetical protein [Desulfohalobiaceae bacterium]
MDLIQKKTQDTTVESFMSLAAQEGVDLAWDRFEAQVPECGFCETGLSCRDCLQGPCISHPFKGDMSKIGVCGKDKDTFAAHSLLRLVLKGSMGYLDQASTLAEEVAQEKIIPENKDLADQLVNQIQALYSNIPENCFNGFSPEVLRTWEKVGVKPEGVSRDLFKASQKLEGGMHTPQSSLLWVLKCSLLGCLADKLGSELKQAVFGPAQAAAVEVNLGVLQKEQPNIVIHGSISPALTKQILESAAQEQVAVCGVCTDPVIGTQVIPQASNQGSQEIPLLTGAVDLIVAGDQGVNPSLQEIARKWQVPVISSETLVRSEPVSAGAKIVADAKRSFETRIGFTRNIPEEKKLARMGFTAETLDTGKISTALENKSIKGVVLLAGGSNVKYSQDKELLAMVEEFLKQDILVLSQGQASVALAKYGFLTPGTGSDLGSGLKTLIGELGAKTPAVIDLSSYGVTQFLTDLEKSAGKALKELPIRACFCEANGTREAVMALWLVTMGVCTYF